MLLQQTTAQAATPYYQAFIARWPRVEDLAAAPIEDVMSAFAGLGYYSRARNLHACAKEIARRGGTFPSEEADLRALPGIGAYTAAAIAAIAFGRQTAPVDGNIARILARLLALEKPIARARRRTRGGGARAGAEPQGGRFRAGADGHRRDPLPPPQSRLRLLPARPRLRGASSWRPGGLPAPRRSEGKTAPARRGVFRPPLRRRLSRSPPPASRPSRLDHRVAGHRHGRTKARVTSSAGAAPVAARWRRLPGEVEQVFTHFALRLTVYAAEFEGGAPAGCFWVTPDAVGAAGFSSMMRKAVEHALAQS